MKRKNLLNETQVRKFMKLANINKDVANNFLAEGLETQGGNKDRTAVKTDANIVPKGSRWLKEQEEDEGEEVLDDLPGDEAPMGDMGDMGDMEGEGSMEDTSEDSVAGLVDAIADAISDYTGVDVSSEQTGEEELDELPPAEGDEMPVDQEVGEVPPEGGEDLDGVEVDDEPDEEEIIAETMKRVTRRIRSMQKREKLAETVTNRIMKKISKQNRRKR